VSTRLLQLDTDKEKLSDRQGKVAGLVTLQKELGSAQAAYTSAQEAYLKARELADRANADYDRLNRAFLDAQAGILASALVDGAPCPVCGSKTHPNPAVCLSRVPTEKDVEAAKKEAARRAKESEDASKASAGAHSKAESKGESANKAAVELFGAVPDDISSAVAIEAKRLQAESEVLNAQIRTQKAGSDRKREIEKGLPPLADKIENLKAEAAEKEKAAITLDAEIKGLMDSKTKLEESLAFRNKAEAEGNIKRLGDRKAALQTAIQTATEALDALRKRRSDLQSKIETLTKQLAGAQAIDVDSLKSAKEGLSLQKKTHSDAMIAISSRLDTNAGIQKKIAQRQRVITNLEGRLTWVKALADTANGQLAGKDKIMLETYVQISYFEQIIRRANLRLMVMSGGQYELKRAENAEDRKTQSGLDLNVIDHYNASERSVKTLSGGESFMASLSLALGLSDEIQSSSGGIRLDAMFVDEGFGSLDEETLSQALKVLNALAESNLLVGIISHVTQLKERIDRQVVVKKEKSGGSRVKIEL
ncbi:MAG: SMC family ATPase, partial [Lachnospiraceae bacterium]|jgi:exonuclease SbcC|nr:SMC family ATPase [Lachnospiraceae bacterium]